MFMPSSWLGISLNPNDFISSENENAKSNQIEAKHLNGNMHQAELEQRPPVQIRAKWNDLDALILNTGKNTKNMKHRSQKQKQET